MLHRVVFVETVVAHGITGKFHVRRLLEPGAEVSALARSLSNSLSKWAQLSRFAAMSQEHGSKAKWLVITIVLVLIFVLGLVLSAIVKKSSTATRKDVEGYPTWEEIVNQVKAIEANHSELVSVQTIGR